MTITDSLQRKALLAGVTLALAAGTATADSGFYIGGSAGGATIEADFDGVSIPGLPSSIDEDDTAFKVFAGYDFDLPVVKLAVEAGYVDFGAPDLDILGDPLTVETTALNLWGILGVDVGLVDLYGKVGYASWEADVSLQGVSDSEDGNDLAYGLGAAFGIGPVQIRGEYELYEFEDVDVSMLSLGVSYKF
ncbi:MAG: porin family protein [Pseudomonadota bacterium]